VGLAKRMRFPAIQWVSLGSGQGTKEIPFLQALRKYKKSLRYFPVEFSQSLLEMAVSGACSRGITTVGLKADIESRRFWTGIPKPQKNEIRVVSLLGNTLGNLDITNLLGVLKHRMRRGDQFIVDGELYSNPTQVMAGYDHRLNRRFALAPLMSLGISESDGSIHFKFKNTRERGVYCLSKSFEFRRRKSITYSGKYLSFKKGGSIKVDQFFAQCALVKFDKRAAAQMQLREKELEEIDFTDTVKMMDRLKNSPLTSPNSEGLLNFEGEINPLYADSLFELKDKVLNRALGNSVERFNENEWRKVKNIFRSYRTWLENKQGSKVEKLGQDRLRSYLGGSYREQVSELIKKDLVVANDLNQIQNLEKLILYQRWLMVLANNFVSFADLYNPNVRALFEMGTLVINERQIIFTMSVRDRQAHKKVSQRSSMYLLYVEVTGRRDKDIKFEIVAPVTSGNAEGLCVGKRGIFFTVDGREWDAEVVDIVVNPISVWESVKAPFQKFAAFVRKQTEKMTKSSEEKLVSTASSASASGTARDLMLGGGLAIAALGSSFAYITKALSEVKPIQVLIALLGLAMIVLLPGIFAGFVKIRKRDMSGLLEAAGWAVNVHMRINSTMGRLFTHTPDLPKDAHKERRDTVGKFVKEFGYNTSQSMRPTTFVLLFISLLLCLMLLLLNFSGWKLSF